jgi:hypothetical protein
MYKRVLRQLERKALTMQHRVDELEAAHSAAALRHSILVSLCDTMSLARDLQQQSSEQEEGDSPGTWFPGLVDSSERALLAQLHVLHYGLVQDPALTPSSTPDGLPTLAPATNCLAVLQHCVAQPCHPRAADMTAEELQQCYTASVTESAMLLNLLHRPASTQQHLPQPPLQQLQALWMRHIHLVVCLGLQQRGDLMLKCVLPPRWLVARGQAICAHRSSICLHRYHMRGCARASSG